MRSHLTSRYLGTTLIMFLIATIIIVGPAFSKSVYLIANHHTKQFDAWNIGAPGSIPPITYQATYNLTHANDPGGITIWIDPDTDPPEATLFITSEFDYGVELVDAKTMTSLGWVGNAHGLAGISMDNVNNILYTVDRDSDALYAYNWDPVAKSLTAVPGMNPFYLPNCEGAFGLAMDDLNGILYIADTRGEVVRGYDTNTWTEVKTFSVSHRPMAIAVDRQRGFIYTVSMNQQVVYCANNPWGSSFGSTLLSQYDLATDIETVVDMGYGGADVDVDEATGYVYLTEGCENDRLTVWDPSTTPFSFVYATSSIGSPAGIAIANGNVGYNPLNLAKNDVVVGVGVPIGSNFTYQITCNNFGNTSDVTGVTIVDDMPVELDFISETVGGVPGTGVYDVVEHTVTWDIGTIPAGAEGPLVELVVRINSSATPGTTIYNYATIESDPTPPTTVIGVDPDCEGCPPGTTVLPPAEADIFGYVTANSAGLLGVYVNLYDNGGVPLMTVQTDETGYYLMEEIADGDYTVEVQVPLGFEPVTPAVVGITLDAADVQVDFELAEIAMGKCKWNYWWWMNQFTLYDDPSPDPWKAPVFTPGEIEEFTAMIFEHFFNRDDEYAMMLELITFADDPARPMTFEEMKDAFIGPYTWSFEYQASRHIRSIMLSLAAGCRSQLTVVTADGATLSQALTYLIGLFQTGERDNLITAVIYLQMIDVSRMLPPGLIPLDVPNIMYKPDEVALLPGTFELTQNHPNPFNPATVIQYDLADGAPVTINVYDILGRNVITLVDRYVDAGRHEVEWEGIDAQGQPVASGVYFYRMEVADQSKTLKMLLMK